MTIVDHAILFITGASSGIGAATARRLSAPGQTSTFRDGTKPGWRPWLPPAGRWCSSTQAPVNGPARVGVSTRPRSLVSAPWRTHFGRKSRNEECGSRRSSLRRTATPMQQKVHRFEGREYHADSFMGPAQVASTIMHAIEMPRSATVPEISIR
jgi:hypothetical protein